MRFPVATAILLAALPMVAGAAADSLGFNPEKNPEKSLGMYIAPENSLIYRMRQPDGSTREFERDYSRPGTLRSVRGWKGRYGRDLVAIESGPDVKGGKISYLFSKEVFQIFKYRSASENLNEELRNRWLIGWSSNRDGTFSNFDPYDEYEKETVEKTLKNIKRKLIGR